MQLDRVEGPQGLDMLDNFGMLDMVELQDIHKMERVNQRGQLPSVQLVNNQ